MVNALNNSFAVPQFNGHEKWRKQGQSKNVVHRFALQYVGLMRKGVLQILFKYPFSFLLSIAPWACLFYLLGQSNEQLSGNFGQLKMVASLGSFFSIFFTSCLISSIVMKDKKNGVLKKLRTMNMFDSAYTLVELSFIIILNILTVLLCGIINATTATQVNLAHLFIYLFSSTCFSVCLSTIFTIDSLNKVIRFLCSVTPIITFFFYPKMDPSEEQIHYFGSLNFISFGHCYLREYAFEENGKIMFKFPAKTFSLLSPFFWVFLYLPLRFYFNQVFGIGKRTPLFFLNYFKSKKSLSTNTVVVNNVSKTLRNIEILKNTNFEISEGSAIGFLGPNGSGKSTLINILSGVYPASSGEAFVFGEMVGSYSALDSTGVCSQEDIFIEGLSGLEHMILFCSMRGIDSFEQKLHSKELLDMVGLDSRVSLKNYSGEMKRRLNVAAACVGLPKFIIFEEPTNGVDFVNKHRVWNLIKSITPLCAVIITSQSIAEVESIPDKIITINEGELSPLKDITEVWGHETFNLVVRLNPSIVASSIQLENVFDFSIHSESMISFKIHKGNFSSICEFLESDNVKDWKENRSMKDLIAAPPDLQSSEEMSPAEFGKPKNVVFCRFLGVIINLTFRLRKIPFTCILCFLMGIIMCALFFILKFILEKDKDSINEMMIPFQNFGHSASLFLLLIPLAIFIKVSKWINPEKLKYYKVMGLSSLSYSLSQKVFCLIIYTPFLIMSSSCFASIKPSTELGKWILLSLVSVLYTYYFSQAYSRIVAKLNISANLSFYIVIIPLLYFFDKSVSVWKLILLPFYAIERAYRLMYNGKFNVVYFLSIFDPKQMISDPYQIELVNNFENLIWFIFSGAMIFIFITFVPSWIDVKMIFMKKKDKKSHDAIVSFDSVSKKYRKKTIFESLTFEIPFGKIFGLAGANGEEKSHIIDMITKLMSYDSGSVSAPSRTDIGLLPQGCIIEDSLTVFQNLIFFAQIRGYSVFVAPKVARYSVSQVSMEKSLKTQVGKLSKEMRKRLMIAVSLIGNPKLIVADEPTSSLDVYRSEKVMKILANAKEVNGSSVLLFPNDLETEAEHFCQNIGFLDKNMKFAGSMDGFKQKYCQGYKVTVYCNVEAWEQGVEKKLTMNFGEGSTERRGKTGVKVVFVIQKSKMSLMNVVQEVSDLQVMWQVSMLSLEDAFLEIIKTNIN